MRLKILFFHFFDSVAGGACCEGHESQGRILISGGSHAGPVSYEYIRTGMELIPFVEQGGFGITAHSDATHFVDVEARALVVVYAGNILTTACFQHFGTL